MKTIVAVLFLAVLLGVATVFAVAIRVFVAIAALWRATDESH
jgi:hypothetical protein